MPKFTITTDRLELKFITQYFTTQGYIIDTVTFENGVALFPCFNKNELNPLYKGTAIIFQGGKRVGIIHYNPTKGKTFLTEDTVHLKFDNMVFYDKNFASIYSKVLSTSELQLEFGTISKLEIAFDTNQDILTAFSDKASSDEYVFSKKTLLEHKLQPYQKITVGNFTLYNKTKELKHSQKMYVRRFHQSNGLDPDEVFRIELRLDDRSVKKLGSPIDITKLGDSKYLFCIFSALHKRTLFFRANTTGSNYSRKEKTWLLDLPPAIEFFDAKRNKAASSDALTLIQAKQILRNWYLCFKAQEESKNKPNWDMFEQIVEHYLLWDWFIGKVNYWDEDYYKIIAPLFTFGELDNKLLNA